MPCAFTGCSSLIKIYIDTQNNYFLSDNGLVYSKDKTKFVACPCGRMSADLSPEVNEIVDSAFFECKELQNVSFGENSKLQAIGSSTFFGCLSLTFIVMPLGLKSINVSSFYGCTLLRKVTFVPGCNITTIAASAFAGCTNLREIQLYDCLELTELGKEAFAGCSRIALVTLPRNMAKLGSKCFSDCPMLAKVVYCPPVDSQVITGDDVFLYSDLVLIYVSQAYNGVSFCGKQIIRGLDKDCRLPTAIFTPVIARHKRSIIPQLCGVLMDMSEAK